MIVGVLGAGRIGRGIALAFALAGRQVYLIDMKTRHADDFSRLAEDACNEIERDVALLIEAAVLDAPRARAAMDNVAVVSRVDAASTVPLCDVLLEGVPETLDAKTACFALACDWARPDTIIASTTSTFSVEDLAPLVTRPERFCNAHWLNPAHLMPLVEISPGARTSPEVVERLKTILVQAGKTPIVCKASPGYIVPRLQALLMNEAARLVEEGVASVADIDTATRLGLGLRFSVLGVLEFIDWGGLDILHYADRYLSSALDVRFTAPRVVETMMAEGRTGLPSRQGFYDRREEDLAAYRKRRLVDFIAAVDRAGLLSGRPSPEAKAL